MPGPWHQDCPRQFQREEGIFGAPVGQFSLHSTTTPNGVRLIGFAAKRSMEVCSTEHDGRHVSNVLDVRIIRAPNTDSEHFLVAAEVRMRRSTSRVVPSSMRRKLDIKKLRSQRTAESTLRQAPSTPIFSRWHWWTMTQYLPVPTCFSCGRFRAPSETK